MPTILNEDSELVAIGRLLPHPENCNNGERKAIEESITANGFFGNLVVQRSTRHILAGNHRFLVAKELGFSELPVTWVDVDDAHARRIMLADNRTSRLGKDNPKKLAALLAEIRNTSGNLTGTGYDDKALDKIVKDLAKESKPAKEKPPAPEEPTRLAVIVLVDDKDAQQDLYTLLIDEGYNPQKTEVTHKSLVSMPGCVGLK